MIFDYNVIWEAMPLYLGGLLTTLKLLAISLLALRQLEKRYSVGVKAADL